MTIQNLANVATSGTKDSTIDLDYSDTAADIISHFTATGSIACTTKNITLNMTDITWHTLGGDGEVNWSSGSTTPTDSDGTTSEGVSVSCSTASTAQSNHTVSFAPTSSWIGSALDGSMNRYNIKIPVVIYSSVGGGSRTVYVGAVYIINGDKADVTFSFNA
jgi:hypothetical protein